MTGLLLGLFALSGLARAHGGFPWSTDVVFAPDDPDGADPVVVTTFGLLATEDDGAWTWVCEEVVGSIGMTAFVALDGGVWLAGGIDGVYRSEDRCTWTPSTAPLEGLYVTSLLVDATVEGRVWATTASGDAENALFRSDDRGLTWEVAHSFGAELSLRAVVQGASGLPMAVLSWHDGLPSLWISADGESWEEHPLAVAEDALVYPKAIDARGGVWLRTPDPYEDALIRVSPSGEAEQIAVSDFKITAFDLGPDQTVVYGTQEEGLRASPDDGATWSAPDDAPIPNCLRARGDTRWVCGHNWSDGAAVLTTPLAGGDPSGWAWTPALWFGDVHRMASCPAESNTATVCGPLWESVAASSGMDLVAYESDTGASEAEKGGCGCGQPRRGRGDALVTFLILASAVRLARVGRKTVA